MAGWSEGYPLNQNAFGLASVLKSPRVSFNTLCRHYDATQIAAASVVIYISVTAIHRALFQEQPLFDRVKKMVFRLGRQIPWVRNTIQGKLREMEEGMRHDIVKAPEGYSVNYALPAVGLTEHDLFDKLTSLSELKGPSLRIKQGKISGTVYAGGEDLEGYTAMLTKAYGMFAWTNPLHPGVFPGVRQMEAEVIAMTAQLFGGDDKTVGAMTSGGTESIVMALKAYRDHALEERGITKPNIVCPRTAHPAFDKACQFFNIHIRKIQEDPVTRKADVNAMRRAMDSNTICLVGSCPQYPHGAVDPIEELAALALSKGVGLHVDCCLGSFIVCMMRKAGFPFPLFDFSVAGVTSISCDTHKYGLSPKGSSVIMYRNAGLRKYQYSIFADWPGGCYGTSGVSGSRPGALIAATWAALMHHGLAGYIRNAQKIIDVTHRIAAGIRLIPGLVLLCEPEASVVCWTSDVFDINRLANSFVHERGWDVNFLQFPPSVHIAVTMVHTTPGVVELFLKDLAECCAPLMATPGEKASGAGAIYGVAQTVPDRSIIDDVVRTFLDLTFEIGEPSTAL